MERRYDKLVRDGIPDIIRAQGERPVARTLTPEEYRQALEEKLREECREALAASGRARLEELADVLEVVRSMAAEEGASMEDVAAIALEKRRSRGGF